MALVKLKPTSPGRRHAVKVVTPGLHKGKPFAALTEKKNRGSGRNSNGHITCRHKGGGSKRAYRIIDFLRNKDNVPARVERIEYDPNRSAHIALVLYADGERRYIICPKGLNVGDTITFAPLPPLALQNGAVACKTMDDRALVCCMCDALEMLSRRVLHCTAVFCATVQEEVGCYGAAAAGHHVAPDIGIAMDVSHAPTPDAPTYRTTPLDKVCMTRGGNIHPGVFAMLSRAAKDANIPFAPTVVLGGTGTDARALQLQQGGIPTGLIELPLRYMHTSVEVGSLDTLHNCAKILTECFAAIGDGWEDALCWND